jgi:UDP-N-acetylglucosamine 3-dehydrogenase
MKVGIIGCGMIARRAHLPAYQTLDNVEIVAVSDNIEQRAKLCQKKFNARKSFTDYRELLKENLDLVSVCTPNSTHAQIAKEAALEGINVLVEKPMATNLQDADDVIETCKQSGVQLCVLHNFRYIPCLKEAKKRIINGRLGRIVSMQATKYDPIPMIWSHDSWFYSKYGPLEDTGIHMIDVINFLCDSAIKDVKVIARDYIEEMGCLNHVLSMMLFRNNASAILDLSWVSGCVESSIKVQGTAGILNVDIRNDNLQEIHGYSTPLEDIKNQTKKSIKTMRMALNKTYFKGFLLYHKQIIQDFISSISSGKEPPIPGKEGRNAVAVLDAIKHSIDS